MKTWFNGKKKHLVIWSVLLIYLFSANPLYVRYVLKNGKPEQANLSLPKASNEIISKLADFQPVRINGEDLYQLHGFAFIGSDPLRINVITILLINSSGNLAFATNPVQYANMIQSYSGFKSGMEQAEFNMLISDKVLKPGTYRIGILLEEGEGVRHSFLLTNSSIVKTPNTIRFVP